MPDLQSNSFQKQEQNVDKEHQISLEQRMVMQDAERHKKFFNSLKPAQKIGSFVGFFMIAFVIVAAVVASVSLKDKNVGTQSSSASEDCGNLQVKVVTASGFYCQDCEAGQYGKLSMCEEDSPTHKCTQVDSGCFKPEV